MKSKKKKLFDAVQMVRDIRDALYRQATDSNFDPKEFERIKQKWTRLLEEQENLPITSLQRKAGGSSAS